MKKEKDSDGLKHFCSIIDLAFDDEPVEKLVHIDDYEEMNKRKKE